MSEEELEFYLNFILAETDNDIKDNSLYRMNRPNGDSSYRSLYQFNVRDSESN